MQKLTFYLIVVVALVSRTGASSVRDGSKAKFLQLIQSSAETKDGFHNPEARYVGETFIIPDDSGPFVIKGVLDCRLKPIDEDHGPIDIIGPVNGTLENGTASVDLRMSSDGGFPIEIKGDVNGTVDIDDIDAPAASSNMVEANVTLTVKLDTDNEVPRPISFAGQLKGILQIDKQTRKEALSRIVDDPEPVGIHGILVGSLIFPKKWKRVVINNPDE